MMPSRLLRAALAAGLSLAAFSSCSNDPTLNNNGIITFAQIDRVGRPAINAIFIPFAKHDVDDRGTPVTDNAIIGPEITTFVSQTAGRDAATTTAAQVVLLANATVTPASTPNPSDADVLLGDMSQVNMKAGYLGIESGNQLGIASGGKLGTAFGGRDLSDDVMTTNLGIAFGNTLFNAGAVVVDDGKENDGRPGTPNLVNDGVTGAAKAANFTKTFPYLGVPL